MTENPTTETNRSRGPAWLRELLLLGVAVVVGLVVGDVLLSESGEPPAEAIPGSTASAAPDASAAPFVAELPSGLPVQPPAARVRGIGKTGEPPEGAAVFPDGTWLEPLNGVDRAPAFPGFQSGLFKPVVSIHTDPKTGLQWYLHEEGHVSTTQMVTHQAGDKKWVLPEWVVGMPVPTQPIR